MPCFSQKLGKKITTPSPDIMIEQRMPTLCLPIRFGLTVGGEIVSG